MAEIKDSARIFKIIGLALLILLLVSAVSQAQSTANGYATANVYAGLVVTADSNIRFGDLLQGVARTVSNAANDSSGVFRIVGMIGADVIISFMLPTYISHTTNAQDRINIFFGPNDGAWDDATGPLPQPESGTSTNFNPYLVLTRTLTDGNLAIFLGGTVVPRPDQTPGAYQGDVVIMVAYIGT